MSFEDVINRPEEVKQCEYCHKYCIESELKAGTVETVDYALLCHECRHGKILKIGLPVDPGQGYGDWNAFDYDYQGSG